MFSIPTTKNLYTFEELDDHAKDNVARQEMEFIFTDDMNCVLEYDVDYNFPNSTIEAEYDYSYTQGSGFNLYGKFALNDLVHFATGFYLNNDAADSIMVKIPHNQRYTYCKWDQREYYDIVDSALADYIEEYGPEDIADYTDKITDAMTDLCSRLYYQGELIIEDYANPEHYEDFLFDEFGNFEGYFWDYPELTKTA